MAGPKTRRIDALICWQNGVALTLNGVARNHLFSGRLGGGDDGGDGGEVARAMSLLRVCDSAGRADGVDEGDGHSTCEPGSVRGTILKIAKCIST